MLACQTIGERRLASSACPVNQRSTRCLELSKVAYSVLRIRAPKRECVYVLHMFFCFFCFFFVFFSSVKNMRQPFSGTAERICMKLLPNDTGENVV